MHILVINREISLKELVFCKTSLLVIVNKDLKYMAFVTKPTNIWKIIAKKTK